ncbi:chymotrypsin inhibitor-like isoform X1 [Augochlora pura]
MSHFTFALFVGLLTVYAEDNTTKSDVQKPESPLCCDALADERCQKNAEWTMCGTACPKTCARPNPEICPEYCLPGCACVQGYVLNDNRECVTLEMCPKP